MGKSGGVAVGQDFKGLRKPGRGLGTLVSDYRWTRKRYLLSYVKSA